MQTLRLGKEHFKKNPDGYWSDYIGTESVADFDGHIEIEGNLGYVRFSGHLSAKGYIAAGAGSGIKASWGIEAGLSIICGGALKVSCRIFVGSRVGKKL